MENLPTIFLAIHRSSRREYSRYISQDKCDIKRVFFQSYCILEYTWNTPGIHLHKTYSNTFVAYLAYSPYSSKFTALNNDNGLTDQGARRIITTLIHNIIPMSSPLHIESMQNSCIYPLNMHLHPHCYIHRIRPHTLAYYLLVPSYAQTLDPSALLTTTPYTYSYPSATQVNLHFFPSPHRAHDDPTSPSFHTSTEPLSHSSIESLHPQLKFQ